jgi:hypothetical protein
MNLLTLESKQEVIILMTSLRLLLIHSNLKSKTSEFVNQYIE